MLRRNPIYNLFFNRGYNQKHKNSCPLFAQKNCKAE